MKLNRKSIFFTVLSASAFVLIVFILSFLVTALRDRYIHSQFPDASHYAWLEIPGEDIDVPTDTGYSVLVDLDHLLLTLYKDGEKYKSWPVSGGSKNSPSPVGCWIVNGIDHWGEGFGGSWISLNVPWGKYGIHGTVEPWAVGQHNISHGCIRMNNKDVRELKGYMSWGVPVKIVYEGIPFRGLKDGRRGSDVYQMQKMLIDLGYLEGNPDGIFGQKTGQALKAFQRAENITVDGILGWESMERLKLRIGEIESAPAPTQPADENQVPEDENPPTENQAL
ncbi:MAG: L,D-transpeptidase family protein [Christensenellales bacterium]|jgi:hypothetical protein